jgi:hypothetical protein
MIEDNEKRPYDSLGRSDARPVPAPTKSPQTLPLNYRLDREAYGSAKRFNVCRRAAGSRPNSSDREVLPSCFTCTPSIAPTMNNFYAYLSIRQVLRKIVVLKIIN